MKVAKLALEDGTVFTGSAFGADGEVDGEVCFNTSMTGYQEILTDPSYRGQIVTMTYPEIGNYGVNVEDVESGRPQLAGFVVREHSGLASNFRADGSLEDYLAAAGVVGISGIDTRALVRRIRKRGALKGVLSTVDPTMPAWWPRPRPARAWWAATWCAKSCPRARAIGPSGSATGRDSRHKRPRPSRPAASGTSWRWTTA